MSFDLKELFGVEKPAIAMAHLPPMPGTPLDDAILVSRPMAGAEPSL